MCVFGLSMCNSDEMRIYKGFSESFIQREGEEKESYEGIGEGDGSEGATGDSDSMKDLVKSLIHGTINGDIIGTEKEEPNESAKTFFKL